MTSAEFSYFMFYCMEGDLENVQRHLINNPDLDISQYEDAAFVASCQCGRLNVAQWLLKRKPDINISSDSEKAFRNACYYGHLHVVKWLLEINPDIDIFAYKNYAFLNACQNQRLFVAQYLYSIDNSVVYKSSLEDYKELFSELCADNKIEMAKWLYQVRPEVFAESDHTPFVYACEFGHYHIAKWIQSIKPYYYVIHHNVRNKYGGSRYSINTEEEMKWQKRKYLVWLASDKCPNKNKKNILKAPLVIPVYISPVCSDLI